MYNDNVKAWNVKGASARDASCVQDGKKRARYIQFTEEFTLLLRCASFLARHAIQLDPLHDALLAVLLAHA
jgi:hypothetical protein